MKSWLVNTNSKKDNGNPNAFKYMLRQNKAATFYNRNHSVDKIQKHDMILLYHNENRIISVGFVVKSYSGHDFDESEKIEHWVDVNWIWKSSFDNLLVPIDPINRNDIGVKMVNGAVNNVTDQINYKELFAQISLRQSF